jgi:hypothetical protein
MATSPETDTQVRFLAENFMYLYQEAAARTSLFRRFQQLFSHALLRT